MKPGMIIVLNGASSSGKTSLVKALQNMLNEPFLNAGLDSFLWMLPKRYLNRPLWDDVLGLADHAGDTGHSLVQGMHGAIASLARSGLNVAADHVLVEPAWVQDASMQFCDLPAYLVGLRCPLEILEQRERQREDRTLGQARLQYDLVHAHGFYDLELDTALLSPEECAFQISQLVQSSTPPTAFRRLKHNLA